MGLGLGRGEESYGKVTRKPMANKGCSVGIVTQIEVCAFSFDKSC